MIEPPAVTRRSTRHLPSARTLETRRGRDAGGWYLRGGKYALDGGGRAPKTVTWSSDRRLNAKDIAGDRKLVKSQVYPAFIYFIRRAIFSVEVAQIFYNGLDYGFTVCWYYCTFCPLDTTF